MGRHTAGCEAVLIEWQKHALLRFKTPDTAVDCEIHCPAAARPRVKTR